MTSDNWTLDDERDSDEPELPEWQVLVTRVQEGVMFISAESKGAAEGQAEEDMSGADWETVHTEVVSVEPIF